MANTVRKALARGIAAGILLVSSIGMATTHAASSRANLTYTSSAERYAIKYPSTWSLNTNVVTKKIGKVELGIASRGIQILAADQVGIAGVLVASHSTSNAKVQATVQALITENATIVGKLHWSTLTVNGVTFIEVGAIEKAGATLQGSVYIMGASHGSHTYYLLRALVLKQKNSAMHDGELTGIINSFRAM